MEQLCELLTLYIERAQAAQERLAAAQEGQAGDQLGGADRQPREQPTVVAMRQALAYDVPISALIKAVARLAEVGVVPLDGLEAALVGAWCGGWWALGAMPARQAPTA